jgi:transposase
LIMNLSNAMAERLNGKIQELKTVGKGYRTFANFRSAILFFHGGLDLYPH